MRILDHFKTTPTDGLAAVLGLLAGWHAWHPGKGQAWYLTLGHAALTALIVYGAVHLISVVTRPGSKSGSKAAPARRRGGRR
ncbi:hypothetical protein [Kitasatospora kifunensis]|uniref:Uncharacterized protein n=1 Tax=Kitasatospora kifunensis TaxID=58351 RepID=A0A7W7RC28_KITKI|nr:hypothetical protein [Kitasatospora kifunensis]MBB4929179.1 hypothetical protein [Kitasatospora kifunensis]